MTLNTSMPVPPRLSMTAYARWVSENWKNGDASRQMRQKDIEERIEKPFRMPAGPSLSEENGLLVHEGDAAGDRSGAVDSDRDLRNQEFAE